MQQQAEEDYEFVFIFGISRKQFEVMAGYLDADKVIAACDGHLDERLGIAVETARWALVELEQLADLAGKDSARGAGARFRLRSMPPTWLEDMRGRARAVAERAEWESAEARAMTTNGVEA